MAEGSFVVGEKRHSQVSGLKAHPKAVPAVQTACPTSVNTPGPKAAWSGFDKALHLIYNWGAESYPGKRKPTVVRNPVGDSQEEIELESPGYPGPGYAIC
jgi:hypothetical protein